MINIREEFRLVFISLIKGISKKNKEKKHQK